MTHSITDKDSIGIFDSAGPYRDLSKATPRIIRGAEPEEIFGLCADFPDEFLDDVMAIRRAGRKAYRLNSCRCHPPIDVD